MPIWLHINNFKNVLFKFVLIGNNLFFLLGTSIFIFGILYLSSIAQKRNIISPEASRRGVHVFVGLIIASSPLIFSSNFLSFYNWFIICLHKFICFESKCINWHTFAKKKIIWNDIFSFIFFDKLLFSFWEKEDFIILSFLILSFQIQWLDTLAAIHTLQRNLEFGMILKHFKER